MPSWLAAFGITAVAVMFGVPLGASRAFDSGWFERSSQTRRSRADRRPTHGGLIAAAAMLVGALATGTHGSPLLATVLVVVVAVVAGHRAERGRDPAWAVPAGWIATALVVPLAGVRAELTGTAWVDAIVTAICVVALTAGVDAVDHTDATASVVAGVASAGLLAAAVHAGDPIATLAACLTGVCLGVTAHAWPPASVRIGVIGPMVLGPTLAIVAIELDLPVGVPRSVLVPLLVLGLLAALAPQPRLDRRLASRGVPPHLGLAIVGLGGAIAGYFLARGDLGPLPAIAIALVPATVVLGIGRTPRAARAEGEGAPARRRRRPPPLVLAGIAGVLVVCGALAAVSLLSARDAMERGRVAALAGLDAARAGDLQSARRSFDRAAVAFHDAKGSLRNPVVRLGEALPVVAPNLKAARALADVGSDLSTTAVAIADRAGAEDLRVVNGRFPIEQSREVGKELATALGTLRAAVATLDRTDSPFLVSRLESGAHEVRDEIADASHSLEVAAEATRLLPSLLGDDGERRWIVAVMSSSELRGAGGLLGDFAEVRIKDGGVEDVRPFTAAEINRATDPARQAEVLPPIYDAQYGGYGTAQFWQNLSVTPDVPSMSQAIAAAYPLTAGGGPVDGVLAIDPIGLAGLLSLTGPIDVPGWPVAISADNVAQVLEFEAGQRLDGAALDRFQGLVVGSVVDALTNGSLPAPSAFASRLAPAVAGGHLRLWSPDPEPEQLFRRIGADGALPQPAGDDFVELVTQDASEAKIDWYLRRSLHYTASFDPTTGALSAFADVRLSNAAPSKGVSGYVIGEVGGPTPPGANRMVVTILTPHPPSGVTDGAGTTLPMNLGREANGLYAASVVVQIPPGASLTLRFELEGAVAAGTSYRLVVGHQPTGHPDDVQVDLEGRDDWVVSRPSGGRGTFRDDAVNTFRADLRKR